MTSPNRPAGFSGKKLPPFPTPVKRPVSGKASLPSFNKMIPFHLPPDQRLLAGIAIVLLALPACADLQLSGRTRGGMVFSGQLAGATTRMLHILPPDSPGSSLLGIPTQSLEFLSVPFPDPPSPRFEEALERLLPLLSFWDRASRESLLVWAEFLLTSGDWPRLHLWSTELAAATPEADLQAQAALFKARALHELGLFIQLDEELLSLNERFSPLQAPLLLCWLNAHRARARGETEEARFWARLPVLRIPVPTGPLAAQLQAFLNSPALSEPSLSPHSTSVPSLP